MKYIPRRISLRDEYALYALLSLDRNDKSPDGVCSCLYIVNVRSIRGLLPSTRSFFERIGAPVLVFFGTRDGHLFVYTWERDKPLAMAKLNGMISAITLGDAMDTGEDLLCVVSIEGQCAIFKIEDLVQALDDGSEEKPSSMPNISTCVEADAYTSNHHDVLSVPTAQPHFSQNLQSNICSMYVGDIDGDGMPELVFGLSDRVLRKYRCHVKRPPVQLPVSAKSGHGQMPGSVGRNGSAGIHFHAVAKWELPGFITALSVVTGSDVCQSLIVSQVNNRFISIDMSVESPLSQECIQLAIVNPVPTKNKVPQMEPLFIHEDSFAVSNYHAVTNRIVLIREKHHTRNPETPVKEQCSQQSSARQDKRYIHIVLPTPVFRVFVLSSNAEEAAGMPAPGGSTRASELERKLLNKCAQPEAGGWPQIAGEGQEDDISSNGDGGVLGSGVETGSVEQSPRQTDGGRPVSPRFLVGASWQGLVYIVPLEQFGNPTSDNGDDDIVVEPCQDYMADSGLHRRCSSQADSTEFVDDDDSEHPALRDRRTSRTWGWSHDAQVMQGSFEVPLMEFNACFWHDKICLCAVTLEHEMMTATVDVVVEDSMKGRRRGVPIPEEQVS